MSVSESMLNAVSTRLSLLPMSEHDLLEVVEIEHSSGLSRWGWNAYHAELRSENRNLMWVARLADPTSPEENEWIAGYVVARLAAGELHINNLAVREKHRQRGIGTALLTRVLEEAAEADAFVAFLEVRAGNAAAQAFYERCGFQVVGRRRNYYPEPREDALIMRLEMSRNP
ncbi:MAG TPA: ribosomal protein S18-alanine N-acetyltransferase [Pyrinomonadaceae bacterium]|nr:ribosomal protein S18-alanine N-acetyltransferase [Pyrinomonadaceae bacterium]